MAESSESESAATQLVSRIGKQLASYKTCPNKDTLVKLLKQAASALPDLKQSETLKLSMKPLSNSLIKHGLLQHKDKDVRLLVGICFCEIIRVLAPNPDFSDAVFRDIFKLVLSIFAELDDIASPFFSKRVKLLETVAKLQFYLLMLDTGCDDLVIKMFKSFFNVVRENHPQSLIIAMSSIMTRILEEKVEENESGTLIFEGKFSEPLLDVILHNLLKETKGESSATTGLAVSVIQNCGEKLERFICMFLRSCIVNRDSVRSELKEFHHEIILQIFRCAPQMLLSVIPNLTHELLTDQVDVRIKALNLIRKLFAMPEHHVAQEYRHLFIEFLNRFSDKSAEVRLTALSCAKAFYMTNPSGAESLEVLAALEARLLDFDDRVRAEAVTVVCDLLKAKLKSFPFELISRVAERLRDKKVSVRKKALQKLLELYQEYCIKCAGGIITLSDQYEQIPCKIFMLCYDKELKEVRPQSLESVLAENLFPASLPIDERTKHWIFMSSLFTPAHLKALKLILSHKRRLQNEMKAYLGLRNKEENKGSEEVEKKIRSSFVKMSASFPVPAKAEECFHKLNAMEDNGIFNDLVELLNEGSFEDAQTSRDNLLTKVGQRNPLFQFLQILSVKCMFNIFCHEHVSSIIDHLSGEGSGEKHFKDSSAQLLLIIISTFPLLLRGSEKKFQLLLLEEVIPFSDELIQILAKEGSTIPIQLSDIYSSLERLCLEGTRAQAKLAVSAIAALVGTSEQFIFSKLCKTLVLSLHMGQNIPTVLQTLGCVAQYSVSTFEAQEKEVTQYIVEEIFLSTDEDMSNDLDSIDENFDCSCSCKLKIYGLKSLVRSFLPHQRACVSRPIKDLLDIILEMLQKGEYCDGTVTCSDKTHIRLAAAKSILRLSRRWDLHISPRVFHFTILVAKDDSPFVRELFLGKIDRLLKEHAIPSRYACAFSITASDSPGDLHDNSWKYMERFIKEYGKTTQIHHTSPAAVTDHPLYIIVYLIYVLAHDSNFPTLDGQNEGDFALFFSPLVFGLMALVNPSFVDGDMDLINIAVLYLRNIFHAIKLAEDCVDEQMTPRLHILADVGMSILNALTCSSFSMSHTPGLVLLPSSIYKANVHSSIHPTFDENFIKKLIRRFRPQISQTASILTKHRLQNHPESLQTDIGEHSKIPSASSKKVDLLIYAMKEHGHEKELLRTMNQDASHSGRRTHPASSTPSDELSVAHKPEQNAFGNSDAAIKSKQHSSSCNSLIKKTLSAEKDFSSSSLKETDVITRRNSITAGASESSRAKHMDSYISKETHNTGEALIGQRIKLWSLIDKCYYFGTVDGFDSTTSTHKITYDSGEAEVVSLDSEEWEISMGSTLDKDLSSLHSCYSDHGEHTSVSRQRKMADEHEFGCRQEKISKEMEKFQSRPLAENIKRRKKVVADTSASEVININENAIGRRTRRKA